MATDRRFALLRHEHSTFGNVGTEGDTITVNGSTYSSILKISHLGGTYNAELLLHHHSDTAANGPSFVFSRARSQTAAHTNVSSGDALLRVEAVGWNTSSRADRLLSGPGTREDDEGDEDQEEGKRGVTAMHDGLRSRPDRREI